MATFVFIEITDRDLNWLFAGIGRVLEPTRPWQSTHLTIRGPYLREVPGDTLKRCRERLAQDVLKIGSAGYFSNPREHVVYLSVDSPGLRSVWWKPDFPIQKFGFNPHISLYRGKDRVLAEVLTRFFKHEAMELNCAEFEVVSHVSRQMAVVPRDMPIRRYPFHERVSGRVRENLLSRLELVVNRHRLRQGMLPNHADGENS